MLQSLSFVPAGFVLEFRACRLWSHCLSWGERNAVASNSNEFRKKKLLKKTRLVWKNVAYIFGWQQHVLFFQLSLAKRFLTLHKKTQHHVPQEALIFQTIGHSLAEVSTFDTFKVLMNMEMRVKLQIHAFSRLCTTPPPSPPLLLKKLPCFQLGQEGLCLDAIGYFWPGHTPGKTD